MVIAFEELLIVPSKKTLCLAHSHHRRLFFFLLLCFARFRCTPRAGEAAARC